MLSVMRALMLSLIMLPGALSAQETWNGLRFGTTEQEVRKVYSGTLERDKDGLVDRKQNLFEMPVTLYLTFEGSQKTLSAIALVADHPFGIDPGSIASLGAIRYLTERLIEKYGKPTTDEDECHLTAKMMVDRLGHRFSCKQMWKADRQNVTVTWHFYGVGSDGNGFGRLIDLTLTYKPLPKEI